MRRLRVLVHNWRDSWHPDAGGAEKYVATVATGLVARGHHVVFRTARYPGAAREETVDGVRYLRAGGRYTIYPRALAVALVGRHRPDVIIDVQNGVPYLTPLLTRRPVVNLVHHVHREQWPVVAIAPLARIGWWLESVLAPRVYAATPYVAVSDSTRRELADLGVDPGRVRVIHNGTDAAGAGHTRAPNPTVTVLGRLVPQKRVEIAMEAVARLRGDLPDIELHVVGSGYWRADLVDHARRLGIADRTVFHGHVSEADKHAILARSWVLALPSLKEGWGLVIVEAGRHGTPTLAFRSAGGPSDSVIDGVTGILVDDGVDTYTAGLRRLLTDDTLRAELGDAVITWVARFGWQETVDCWEKVLLDANANHGASPST
jgi:glycosyltransferase involved in cell wall biosynthesis